MLRTPAACLTLLLAVAVPSRAGAVAPGPQLAAAEVALSGGLLAFQAGDYEAAVELLGKAAELNPAEGTPRYWRGLALLRLGRAREAATEIEASLAARHLPEVDRDRALTDLAAARKSGEGEPRAVEPPEWRPNTGAIDDRGLWEGAVGLSAGSDSNPSLLARDLSLPVPGSGSGDLIRGETGEGTGLAGLRLGIYPFHGREGPVLGVALDAGRSFHRDFGFLDLNQVRGTVQVAFGSDSRGSLEGLLGAARVPLGAGRFSALLQAGGTSWQLDGASYLKTLDVAGSLTLGETRDTATRFDLGYSDRTFSSGELGDPRRSGDDLTLQVSQLFYFGRAGRGLRLGALFVDRQAEAPFAEKIREGNAGVVWPLALRWTVLLEANVRKDLYDHPESNLFQLNGRPRSDTTSQTAATVVWSATDRLRLILAGAYTRRTSNVGLGAGLPGLGYRRTVVSLGSSWVF
ncbi:MAG: hypothetical protein WAM82_24950 [Thermoanaerobaculia bacterium]